MDSKASDGNYEDESSSDACSLEEFEIKNDNFISDEEEFSDDDENEDKELKVNYKAQHWSFTWHDYTNLDIENLKKFCKANCITWVFGKELTKKGTPHLQGCMDFKSQRWKSAILKKFPFNYLRKTRNKIASEKYAMKDGEYFASFNIVRNPLQGKILYKWQKEICDIIETEPDDRKIHWYWEEKGCTGKTTLAKSLCITRNDCLVVQGTVKDVKHGVTQWINAKKELRVIFYCISRKGIVDYDVLEVIKDGSFFNTKYETGMVNYNPPHMFVFANKPPNQNELSQDRWKIVEIV